VRYPALVTHRSPTFEGFRAVFRWPALALAEIAWRWTFGAAALCLLISAVLEYLDTLTVTSGEQLFLHSRQPFLVVQAITQIFRGSGPRVVAAALIVLLTLALSWILTASFGRAATVTALLEYFGDSESKWELSSLLGLHFLRVALAFAGVIGIVGAAIVAGFASSPADPRPGFVLLIFLALASLVGLLWSTLNWHLSVAPLFVGRDGQDTLGAIAASVHFARSNASPVFWSSTVFGLLHLLAFIAASIAALGPMALAGILPRGIIAIAITLITLIYFALADLLYIGRLAAYAAIANSGGDLVNSASAPPTPQPVSQSASPAPDDDNILSDIPGLLPPPEPAG